MSTRKVCFSLPAGSVELAQSRPLFPCPASMSNIFLMSLGKYWLIWSLFICTGSTGRGGVKSPRSSPSYSSSSPSSPASTLTLRSSANRTLSPFLLAIRSITSWSCAAVRAVRALLRLPVLLFPNSQRRAWNVWKCDPKLVNVSLRVNGAPNSKGGQLQSPLLNLVADLPKHLEKICP